MRHMEHSTASQPPSADRSKIGQHRTQADADTDKPYIHHYRSVITPGLMSVPPMPAWLRKLFRRKDTPATR
jgi:hypothetical protein